MDMKMPRISFVFIALVVIFFLFQAARAGDTADEHPKIVRRTAWHHVVRVDLFTLETKGTAGDYTFTGIMPLPRSNGYQDVRRLEHSDGAETMKYLETDWEYLAMKKRVPARTLNPQPPTSEMHHVFEVVLYDLAADFRNIRGDIPQNTKRYPHTRYAGSYPPYIEPENKDIGRMAQSIKEENNLREGDQLGFARAAFRHVVDNFGLVQQKTNNGLSRLSYVLRQREGNHCDLVSVYVSLLRRYGIPARHLVAMRLDGTPHTLAEFYLEESGWIPVDVVMQMLDRDKKADYFGLMRASNGIVIVGCDLGLTVSPPGEKAEKVPLLQRFMRWPEHLNPDLDDECFRFGPLKEERRDGPVMMM